jgi:aryl-alcohol dehydrogenase-like predicted oxidoreductase
MDRDWLSPKTPGTTATPVLGTMNFGKRTPEPEAVRIMERALARGVDWFDTANAYGESEEILGRFLRSNKDAAYIATKSGIGSMKGPREGLAAPVLLANVDKSLKRLQIDHIDLYYLHAPDRATPIEETIGALEAARKAGKIGAWAVSNFASWRIAAAIEVCGKQAAARPRVSQVLYNLLIRQLDLEYFDYAQQAGIHTTIYNPLAGGLLAGKDTVIPGGRFDGNAVYQRRYLTSRLRELAEAFARLAADAGIDRVQLAYSWVSNRPAVDSVLLGPATVEQLDAGIDGCQRTATDALNKKIDEIYQAFTGTDVSYAR